MFGCMKSPGILLDLSNNCNYFTKLDMKKMEHSLDQFKRLLQMFFFLLIDCN